MKGRKRLVRKMNNWRLVSLRSEGLSPEEVNRQRAVASFGLSDFRQHNHRAIEWSGYWGVWFDYSVIIQTGIKRNNPGGYSGTVKKFVLNLTKKEQGSSGGTNFTSFSKDTWTWFLRTWIFGCLDWMIQNLVLHEHLDFGLLLGSWITPVGWPVWFFWIFLWFFFGSLDQVFLLDIGVLVSINLWRLQTYC